MDPTGRLPSFRPVPFVPRKMYLATPLSLERDLHSASYDDRDHVLLCHDRTPQISSDVFMLFVHLLLYVDFHVCCMFLLLYV